MLISVALAHNRQRVVGSRSAAQTWPISPRIRSHRNANTQPQTSRCAVICSTGTACSAFRYSGSNPQMKNAVAAAARPRGSVLIETGEGGDARAVSFIGGKLAAGANDTLPPMSSVLDLSRRLLALSQTGLHFCAEEYDR